MTKKMAMPVVRTTPAIRADINAAIIQDTAASARNRSPSAVSSGDALAPLLITWFIL
jgi:hypothetical protein